MTEPVDYDMTILRPDWPENPDWDGTQLKRRPDQSAVPAVPVPGEVQDVREIGASTYNAWSVVLPDDQLVTVTGPDRTRTRAVIRFRSTGDATDFIWVGKVNGVQSATAFQLPVNTEFVVEHQEEIVVRRGTATVVTLSIHVESVA